MWWVEGDQCEVVLHVVNPLPFELDVISLQLMTEVVAVYGVSANVTLPAESVAVPVRLYITPNAVGTLRITGYMSEVMGVRSQCRLRDLPHLSATPCLANVVAAMPLLQVQMSVIRCLCTQS